MKELTYTTKAKNSAAVLFPIIIVCITLTLLQGWIPHWGATWVFMLAGLLLSFMITPRFYSSKLLLCWLIFVFVVTLNSVTGDEYWGRSFLTPVQELTMLVFAPAMTYYAVTTGDSSTEDRIINWSLAVLIITSIASISIDIINPGAIRQATVLRYAEQDNSMSLFYYRFGMSNYSLPHAIPSLIPGLVCVIKNKRLASKTRTIFALIIILALGLVWISGAFTALILSFLSLLVSVILSYGNRRRSILWASVIGLIFIPFLINPDLVYEILNKFSSFVGDESWYFEKIVDAQNSMATGEVEGDMSTRLDLYDQSLSLGVTSLLIGTNGDIGGHSTIIDHFATLGIIGFIPFIILLHLIIKQEWNFLPKESSHFFVLGVLMSVLMLLLKSMSNPEMWLYSLTLLPLIIHKYSVRR